MERLLDKRPDPEIELNWKTEYQLLVAIILSAQSTDKGVNKVTDSLFKDSPDVYSILKLGKDKLGDKIKTLGLWRRKADNIYKASEIIVDKYNSVIPQDFDNLVSLPGVGRKSANVFLSCARGEPRIGVDTHVFRVSHRLGLSNASSPEGVEKDLMRLIPEYWLKKGAHHLLVLHGRYVCTAKKPKCYNCPISDLCYYFISLNKACEEKLS